MKSFLSSILFGALVAAATAAPLPPEERTVFTAKEIAQGFREQVVLARPLPDHRATAAASEMAEGVRVRETFPRFRDLRIIELDASDDAIAAVERLRATGRYEFVEHDLIRHVEFEPADPQFTNGTLWGLKNNGASNGIVGADIDAPAAWDIIREAPNVVVAVIDTGVNINHQDLAGNIWQNPNPTFGDVNGARFINGIPSGNPADDNGHGTHVAGTIGAVGNNNLGVTGIAWRVKIMPIKVFPATGYGSVSDIVRGVNYAVTHGAHIINASYGESGSTGFVPSAAEVAAITGARQAGVIFVAAAGNAALNIDLTHVYPANHGVDNMVTVGASTRRDELALFSNYGSGVDLFAPGSEIVSLAHTSNTATATKSGTSMAAPHVAGALALLKARFPNDNYRQLINRLLRGVDPGERFLGKAQTGGRLNVFKALSTDSNLPFNDNFADRPRLTGNNVRVRSSNAGATVEPGEPAHEGSSTSFSLWWEWSPSISGLVTIDTDESGQDTMLAVYRSVDGSVPNSPANLTLVAANDDNPDAMVMTSKVTFSAQAGMSYQIAVSSRTGQGDLVLLNIDTTPINDVFTGAITLTGESTRVTAHNANCSREPGEPTILGWRGGHSLWYRWTAPRTGRFQISAISPEFDPVLGVFTGPAVNALTYVAENNNADFSTIHTGSLCTVDATAGTTYSIMVDSKDPFIIGQFTLTIVDSLWQGVTGDNVTGSAAVGSDGTLYVGSTDRSVYAFTSEGYLRWSAPTGGLIDTCSPAIGPDGTVYIGSNDGKFYAFTAAGATKWTHNFGSLSPMSNSPALAADGTIYVKAGDGFLYALNPVDGSTKWRQDVHSPLSYASPSVAPDGTIYQGSDDKHLYAFNPDGSTKWVFAADNDIFTAPAIDGAGNIYFGVLNTGKLFSVSPAGVQRWAYSGATLGATSSPALSSDGATVYFAGYDAKLHAVNTATGVQRWTYTLGNEVRASSPAVDANGVIYIGCYDYKLYAINPDGTLKRTYDTGDWVRSSPAIYGTTLYVGSNDAKLYAFDIGAGPAAGPWAQYRHNVRRTGRAIVFEPLAIVVAPQAQTLTTGQALTLSVTATGETPLVYEWRKDGQIIAGATSATYSVTSVTAANAGSYIVTIHGPQGSVTSAPVNVIVEALVPGRLVNLSVRAGAGAGAQTLTVGFVVAGSGSKSLLIRGVGPSLARFGVTPVLGDPELRLLSGTSLIDSNADWGGGSAIATVSANVGAFVLDAPTSKDAALLRSVPAGLYTVQVADPNGATGIALAEVYDTESTETSSGPTTSRLVNLSARAQVNGGTNLLVAGFAISGSTSKQILIRGIGPALAAYGITDALANPKLEIFRGATKIHENDDWGGAATLTAAFDSVSAFRLTDTASRDAALLVTLPPDSYTVQISGANGASGVALIELYELP